MLQPLDAMHRLAALLCGYFKVRMAVQGNTFLLSRARRVLSRLFPLSEIESSSRKTPGAT
jgi:hypothetical protein